jgi:ectoine hydroxylase-related dioxygenase (phytanoyl-CoA dioxygenase family)
MTSSTAPASETYQPFVESSPREGAAALRARMQEHGYLFFRALVPADAVLAVRRDVLEQCALAGWLDPQRELLEAVVAPAMQPTTEGKQDYNAVYRKVLKLPRFHELPCQPALMAVAQILLGDTILVHPRRIGRLTFPNNTLATTPPHQDYFYIRGSVNTYSCWVPLGECPTALGGLAVWPGSQTRGFLEHSVHQPGAVGGRAVPLTPGEAAWHTADYRTGDALFFTAFTVHRALPNLTRDRLRVSTDNRYQRPDEEIEPGALRPHFNLD